MRQAAENSARKSRSSCCNFHSAFVPRSTERFQKGWSRPLKVRKPDESRAVYRHKNWGFIFCSLVLNSPSYAEQTRRTSRRAQSLTRRRSDSVQPSPQPLDLLKAHRRWRGRSRRETKFGKDHVHEEGEREKRAEKERPSVLAAQTPHHMLSLKESFFGRSKAPLVPPRQTLRFTALRSPRPGGGSWQVLLPR